MSVLKQGTLISVEPPKYKKIKYTCELWSTKVIDLKGQGKHSNSKKCIHLARCTQIEPDNYSSEKFFIKHSDGFTDDLIAENETERSEWIECICEVCGLTNPLRKPAVNVLKKSKAPPPLPPPKPMSEEKIRREENNMYEEISGDEGEDEYSNPLEVPPDPEGGILGYDYADMDRGIRPMSYHEEYGGGSGGSGTGTSGGGAFHSNDSGSDDDEYIEPMRPPPKMFQQKPPGRNQYMNTLDGRDLMQKKVHDMNSATLPHHSSSSQKDKFGRKPMGLPGNKGASPSASCNDSELLSMLSRRKKRAEGSTTGDDVFTKEPPKVPVKSPPKACYQNTGGLTAPDNNERKWSTGSSPGQQRKNYTKIPDTMKTPPQLPEKQNSRRNSRSELPIQDPPWLKKKTQSDNDDRLNKPCPLPVQDPPWLKKKPVASVDDKPSKPLPSPPSKPLPSPPSHDLPWMKKKSKSTDEDRLNKPCPLPPSQDPPWLKKKTPSDKSDGGSKAAKPLPRTPPSLPQKTKSRDARFSLCDSDNSPPPPPPPERGSSKRDIFEETPPKVANKSKQLAGKKPVPPPVKPKSPPPRSPQPVFDDDDDDDDFPTADQYKKKFANPSYGSTTARSPYYRDSIDNRPPVPPPKQVSGYHYR